MASLPILQDSNKMFVAKIKIRAFSLIELSIVMLVLGILVAGVMKGRNLIEKSALVSARTLTESSPVVSIDDLLVWYESTSITSFDSNVDMGDASANSISIWYDLNLKKMDKFHITQSDDDKKPTLARRAINGLPAVFFDGINDYLMNTNLLLSPSLADYSMFVVGKVLDISDRNPIFGQYFFGNVNDYSNHFLRINAGGTISSNQYPPSGGGTLTTYTIGKEKDFLIAYTRENHIPRIYVDGDFKKEGGGEIYSAGNPNSTIFGYRSSKVSPRYFYGYMSEIIVFKRSLKKSEREAVEKYLGQKWDIGVSHL